MTDLGRLVRAIRLKKNISEIKAARRCGFSLESYSSFEREPEKTPVYQLHKIFKAIETSDDEYSDFILLCQKCIGKRGDNRYENLRVKELENLLEDINFHRKEKPQPHSGVINFEDKRKKAQRGKTKNNVKTKK